MAAAKKAAKKAASSTKLFVYGETGDPELHSQTLFDSVDKALEDADDMGYDAIEIFEVVRVGRYVAKNQWIKE